MNHATSPDTPKLATISEAEQLIRERAVAAAPGPWTAQVLGSEGYAVMGQPAELPGHKVRRRPWIARCGMEAWEVDRDNATYVASWHPIVATAVADAMAWFLGIHWPKASSSWSGVHRDDEHHEGDPRCTEACVVDYVICNGCGTRECSEIRPMLTIALAYLGRDS